MGRFIREPAVSITAAATLLVALTTLWQSVQTEAVIEQMRLEQRPWLAVAGNPELISMDPGEPARLNATVRNSGQTPGTVTALYAVLFALPAGTDIPGAMTMADNNEAEDSSVRDTVIAPNTGQTLQLGRFVSGAQGIPNVRAAVSPPDATHDLYLILRFQYTGAAEETWRTESCFRYDGSTFVTCLQYNSME